VRSLASSVAIYKSFTKTDMCTGVLPACRQANAAFAPAELALAYLSANYLRIS
jgi:hypothetical protein